MVTNSCLSEITVHFIVVEFKVTVINLLYTRGLDQLRLTLSYRIIEGHFNIGPIRGGFTPDTPFVIYT